MKIKENIQTKQHYIPPIIELLNVEDQGLAAGSEHASGEGPKPGAGEGDGSGNIRLSKQGFFFDSDEDYEEIDF